MPLPCGRRREPNNNNDDDSGKDAAAPDDKDSYVDTTHGVPVTQFFGIILVNHIGYFRLS